MRTTSMLTGVLLMSGSLEARSARGVQTCGGAICQWDHYCDTVMDRCMACYGLCRPARIRGDLFATQECENECPEYYKYQMRTTTSTSTMSTPPLTRTEKFLASQHIERKGEESSNTLNTYLLVVLMLVSFAVVTCLIALIVLIIKLKKKNLHTVNMKQCSTADKCVMTDMVERGDPQAQQQHIDSLETSGSVHRLGPEQSSSPNGQYPRPHLHHEPARIVDDATSHDKRMDNFLISGQQPISAGYYNATNRDSNLTNDRYVESDTPLLESSDQSDGAYSHSVTPSSEHENETLLKTPASDRHSTENLSLPA